jgi:hypothetical protein
MGKPRQSVCGKAIASPPVDWLSGFQGWPGRSWLQPREPSDLTRESRREEHRAEFSTLQSRAGGILGQHFMRYDLGLGHF